jgi:hypothetical protein
MVINVKRGETKRYLISVYESDGVTPVDLTGLEVLFTVKQTLYDLDTEDSIAYIRKTATHLAEIGKAEFNLTETDTFIPAGSYYYDIKIRKEDGTWTKYKTADTFNVLAQVTNRT